MAILHVNMLSDVLARTVDVDIILPLDRTSAPFGPKFEEKPLKTLYLLHGILGDHGDWIKGTRIALWAMDRNLCVVMPSGENAFYTDQPAAARPYGTFIGKELVELTRKMFPLSHRREDTFIGGLSMGGYGALRNGLEYSDTFGAIVALSSALVMESALTSTDDAPMFMSRRCYYETVFGDLSKLRGGKNDVDALVEGLVKAKKPVPDIFLSCGTEDSLYEPNLKLHKHLTDLGVQHRWVPAPGAHSWDFWDEHLKEALDTFLPLDAPVPTLHSGNITGK